MDSPYGSVTPSSTHLGNFASNLSGGQMYGPGAPLGGAPTAANFNMVQAEIQVSGKEAKEGGKKWRIFNTSEFQLTRH